MRPICVPCQRFFKPTKTGICFIEGMPTDEAQPGIVEADKWKPYKLWMGDQFTCPGCGAITIVGVARHPISEHFMPNFENIRQQLGAEFQVNDC